MKPINHITIAALAALALGLGSCTNLDETLYDQVGTENYYNTHNDVVRAAMRPFEHAYWSIMSRHVLNELTADQLITPTRDGWWDDSGLWRKYHDHSLDVEDGSEVSTEWNGCFQGIGQCNYVIEDLSKLDPTRYGFTQAEFANLQAQDRTLRAWFYLRLLDAFRHVPLAVSFYDHSLNTDDQVEPRKLFDFIESELKESLPQLARKESLGTQSAVQGQWTQAAAAALLVRLYLNAEVYIGEDRCAAVADDILSGKYGAYQVAGRWDAAFDWDNDACDEVIFGFPGAQGYSHWHYDANTYWWTVPARARYYLGDSKCKAGDHNCKYAASPSYDPTGHKYAYELGMPVERFRKYQGDERMRLYRNLGNGRREGMFVYGYLDYTNEQGEHKRVQAPERPYDLYIRDAVGQFQGLGPEEWLSDATSQLESGDHNSGWHFAKYPFYADNDARQLESDYTEIRLPEVIYSLAECRLRQGRADEAARLLNTVRRRCYTSLSDEQLRDVLYAPEGRVRLDEREMLDEWGREFFAESRRRIDLIRFGQFHKAWWDKAADNDSHTDIFPIMRPILNANTHLKQNPGYSN